MRNIDHVFEVLGGTSESARILGVKQSAASEMKRRGSIPVRYWANVVSGMAEKGTPITYDDLVAMHAPRDKTRAA